MLKKGVDASKLYFATSDGFFLPPNGSLETTLRPNEPLHLLTWQAKDAPKEQESSSSVPQNLFVSVKPKLRKRDIKANLKLEAAAGSKKTKQEETFKLTNLKNLDSKKNRKRREPESSSSDSSSESRSEQQKRQTARKKRSVKPVKK